MSPFSSSFRRAPWLAAALALLINLSALAQPENKTLRWEDYWKTDLRIKHGRRWPMVSITMGGKRQLFVDNFVIEYMKDLTRTLHQPVKYERNPVVPLSKPWEGEVTMGTVIREEDGRFRFWYFSAAGVCYAESKDGIHWEKPALRLHEWTGSADEARKFGIAVPRAPRNTARGITISSSTAAAGTSPTSSRIRSRKIPRSATRCSSSTTSRSTECTWAIPRTDSNGTSEKIQS